jgi:hypothetical protein
MVPWDSKSRLLFSLIFFSLIHFFSSETISLILALIFGQTVVIFSVSKISNTILPEPEISESTVLCQARVLQIGIIEIVLATKQVLKGAPVVLSWRSTTLH